MILAENLLFSKRMRAIKAVMSCLRWRSRTGFGYPLQDSRNRMCLWVVPGSSGCLVGGNGVTYISNQNDVISPFVWYPRTIAFRTEKSSGILRKVIAY